jgi:hypothetical protein
VITLHGDAPSRARYWPPYSAAVPKSALADLFGFNVREAADLVIRPS